MLMLVFGCVVGLAAILTAVDASLVDGAIGDIKNDPQCVERLFAPSCCYRFVKALRFVVVVVVVF
jgi:hypothetical protein